MEVTTNSELGMAIFKARVGDKVGVNLPAGRTEFEIVSIEE
jgi:transcription elongation GreA/GreB family factor